MSSASNSVFRALLLSIVLLLAADAALNIDRHIGGASPDTGLYRLLALDLESNIPTWFSSTLLSGAAALTAWLAATDRTERRWWSILAAALLFVSMDESVALHERVSIKRMLGGGKDAVAGQLVYSTWMTFGAVSASAFGLSMRGFLSRIDCQLRNRLIVSGAVYAAGALGAEVLGFYASGGWQNPTLLYHGLTLIEEGAEMLGVALYIRAVLPYADSPGGVRTAAPVS